MRCKDITWYHYSTLCVFEACVRVDMHAICSVFQTESWPTKGACPAANESKILIAGYHNFHLEEHTASLCQQCHRKVNTVVAQECRVKFRRLFVLFSTVCG